MSPEFGLRSEKSTPKILVSGGLKKKERWLAFLVEIINWGRGCNNLKWLAFPKFKLIKGVVVIVGGS